MILQMGSFIFLFLIIASNSVSSINRPVYKVLLTQRGFTQFLQYDVTTPPIREFTFCVWLRFFDLSYEQSIFTYLAHRNNRVVRLWLESGGQYIKISLNGRRASSFQVDITKNTWRHICISYQSDFGTWAFYLDGQLISCEVTHSLFGNILPAGGSVIIGYGTTENGMRSGMEGEVFGANMILISTIERNYTISKNPQYQQKQLNKKKMLVHNYHKYTILENLTDDVLSVRTTTTVLPLYTSSRSFIKIKKPLSEIELDLGIEDKYSKKIDNSDEKEAINLRMGNKRKVQDAYNINAFFNAENNPSSIKFRGKNENKEKFSNAENENVTISSEFNVISPFTSFEDYFRDNIKLSKTLNLPLNYRKDNIKIKPDLIKSIFLSYKPKLRDIQITPPPENNFNIYGQWINTQFANSPPKHLKRFNYEYKDQIKVSPTIPDFKMSKVRSFLSEFQKKSFTDFNMDINKRVNKSPQLKIDALEDDIRSQIKEERAMARTVNKEIHHSGQLKNTETHRSYRNTGDQYSSNEEYSSRILKRLKYIPQKFDIHKDKSYNTMLPFVKTSEYSISKDEYHTNKIFTRSLSDDNKWYSINSFYNDPTPRPYIPYSIEWKKIDSDVRKNISQLNRRNSSINVKYIPENNKIVKNLDTLAILNARTLAMEISNLSNFDNFSKYSILKYNQGFLPIKNKFKKSDNSIKLIQVNNDNDKSETNKNNVNRTVKIENAFKEQFMMDNMEELNKDFTSSNEKISDVSRNKSNIYTNSEKLPPSLCKNVETDNHRFYVQPDGSVDMTHIWSPIKEKNVGVHFVLENYKKCSLQESKFQRSPLLLIDWNKTPVRLFGGANPKKTTDLCGFF